MCSDRVVGADPDWFVEWAIARMAAYLGRADRDKAVSDALWATLFCTPERGTGPEFLPDGSQQHRLTLSGDVFPGREAVLVRWPGVAEWVLVFESPWEADRGGRLQRVMRALPGGIDSCQVWIWVPREPSPHEADRITYYMAAARVLRNAFSEEGADQTGGWLIRALQEPYLGASRPALEAIIACYRQGMVVTDGGTWRPGQHTDSLADLVGDLVAWVLGRE